MLFGLQLVPLPQLDALPVLVVVLLLRLELRDDAALLLEQRVQLCDITAHAMVS